MLGGGASLLGFLTGRVRESPDGEGLMSLNRGLFCVTMAVYIWIIEGLKSWFAPGLLVGGLLLTFGIFMHLVLNPTAHRGRRAFAVLVDLGTICLVMHRGDEAAAIFFPLLLWVICGNGFRFGLPGLWLSTALSIVGFSAVAATTSFWSEALSATIGLIIGLIILPAYVSILINKLYQAKARAEAASQSKTEFLTNVSHELRTPLQAIVGASGLLADTKITKEQAGLVQTVTEASNILLTSISELLRFSSIEKGRLHCETEEFNVVELLDEVRRLTSAACQVKGLSVSMHMGQGTPRIVRGDRRNIRDVLLSLAGNAIKFTDKGNVLLAVDMVGDTAQSASLVFEVIDTGIGVSLGIQDRVFEGFFSGETPSNPSRGGLGLGLAICKRLVVAMGGVIGLRSGEEQGATFWFHVPVERATDRTTPSKADVALFMPYNIAKGRLYKLLSDQSRDILDAGSPSRSFSEILQMIQGKQRVLLVATPKADKEYLEMSEALSRAKLDPYVLLILVDEMGQAVPTLDLRRLAPLRLAWNFKDEDMIRVLALADSLAADKPADDIIMQPDSTERYRVLIVDDNRTSRTIFSKMVENFGHLYHLAVDGEEALNALEQGEFSLVLMDVNMPGIDGLEVTRLRRLIELGGTRTPIVGMTADASPGLIDRCKSAGMDECVVKPVSLQVLQQLLKTFSTMSVQSRRTGDTLTVVRNAEKEPEIDEALIVSLENIGGQAFVKEVLSDFRLDAASLLDDLSSAVANADIAKSRFLGHALASASANIGAIQVRKFSSKIEKAPELKLKADGLRLVEELKQATANFMKAMEQRSSQ